MCSRTAAYQQSSDSISQKGNFVVEAIKILEEFVSPDWLTSLLLNDVSQAPRKNLAYSFINIWMNIEECHLRSAKDIFDPQIFFPCLVSEGWNFITIHVLF